VFFSVVTYTPDGKSKGLGGVTIPLKIGPPTFRQRFATRIKTKLPTMLVELLESVPIGTLSNTVTYDLKPKLLSDGALRTLLEPSKQAPLALLLGDALLRYADTLGTNFIAVPNDDLWEQGIRCTGDNQLDLDRFLEGAIANCGMRLESEGSWTQFYPWMTKRAEDRRVDLVALERFMKNSVKAGVYGFWDTVNMQYAAELNLGSPVTKWYRSFGKLFGVRDCVPPSPTRGLGRLMGSLSGQQRRSLAETGELSLNVLTGEQRAFLLDWVCTPLFGLERIEGIGTELPDIELQGTFSLERGWLSDAVMHYTEVQNYTLEAAKSKDGNSIDLVPGHQFVLEDVAKYIQSHGLSASECLPGSYILRKKPMIKVWVMAQNGVRLYYDSTEMTQGTGIGPMPYAELPIEVKDSIEHTLDQLRKGDKAAS